MTSGNPYCDYPDALVLDGFGDGLVKRLDEVAEIEELLEYGIDL